VLARQQALQGLKGLARIQVSSADKNFHGQQVLLARRPTFLRVESLGPLGTPILYMVTDGERIKLYNSGENRYYQGAYQARAFSFALPLELSPEEIVAFLLGGIPSKGDERPSLRADLKEGLWVLDLRSLSSGESQTLWVHPRSYHILRAECHQSQLSYQLAFTHFRQWGGIHFPQRMTLTVVDPRARILVDFQEVELNPHWESEDFHLPVPKGAMVLPLP
jgi:outer membrane lipoprotein-sorting protein